MVPPVIHTRCFGVRAAAGYRSVACCSSISSFILLKYIYSWLIVCYCTCSNSSSILMAITLMHAACMHTWNSHLTNQFLAVSSNAAWSETQCYSIACKTMQTLSIGNHLERRGPLSHATHEAWTEQSVLKNVRHMRRRIRLRSPWRVRILRGTDKSSPSRKEIEDKFWRRTKIPNKSILNFYNAFAILQSPAKL